MPHGAREVEIKLRVPDPRAAHRLLRGAGFRVSRSRVFEANTVFDTRGLTLRRKALLLRMREAGGRTILTYKGTPAVARHKSREELEVELPGPGPVAAILDRLGFHPVFRYEKYRTEFQAPGSRGVATLDETPIGLYLELEGAPGWIDRTARKLGFAESDYITASYGRLYLEWCREHRVRPTNMVFLTGGRAGRAAPAGSGSHL
jgi:adenylate cyclase class 2